jgi:hypothetical protein
MAKPFNTNHLRDIALVLLGAAMVKDSRQRVLDSLPSGSLVREVDILFDCLRKGDYLRVKEWFSNRGAVIENGKDAIDACIDAILEVCERAKIDQVIKELEFYSRSSLVEKQSLVAKLRECAERLER